MPFAWLFGKKKEKAPEPPAPPPKPSAGRAETVEKYEAQKDLWERKVNVLEKQVADLKEEAKKYKLAGNDRLALAKFQDMKAKEKTLQQQYAQLGNLETMMHALRAAEDAKMYTELVKAVGHEIKESAVDVDKVDDIVDEAQEAIRSVQEVQDILGTRLNTGVADEDVEGEFAAMMAEEDSKEDAKRLASLEVPSSKISGGAVATPVRTPAAASPAGAAKSKVEADMAELEALMAA